MKQNSILNLEHDEARNFFLKEESYCNIDLPPYFTFSSLLHQINSFFDEQKKPTIDVFKDCCQMSEICETSYKIFSNKDGKYDWRPLELIHPLLYVVLVREITEKDSWNEIKGKFKKIRSIECTSIPRYSSNPSKKDKGEQILTWWEETEQKSITFGLDFQYLLQTDITNFYPSIYTHSIPWVFIGKKQAKKNKGQLCSNMQLGNKIDKILQLMSYSQTNGIPQGSVLMDFIAEILLAHIDQELFSKIKEESISKYKIIRYRDDYRIFSQNSSDADRITQILAKILVDYGLKLNPKKTQASEDIVYFSQKEEKLEWLKQKASIICGKTLQKQLMIIYLFAKKYKNSGSIVTALTKLLKDFEKSESKNKIFNTDLKEKNVNIEVLISIVTEIAFLNPKTHSSAMAVLSFLFQRASDRVIKKSVKKLLGLQNGGLLEIWLQRAICKHKIFDKFNFNERMCHLIVDPKKTLWDLQWIGAKQLKQIFNKNTLIDLQKLNNIPPTIKQDEVNPFVYLE